MKFGMQAAIWSDAAVESALRAVMRRDAHVVGLGHRGDLLHLHDAAGVADVRLHDVGGMRLEDLAKAVARVDALADRDRDRDVLGDLLQRADVERIGRLLDPGDVELLEAAAEADRLVRGEPAARDRA